MIAAAVRNIVFSLVMEERVERRGALSIPRQNKITFFVNDMILSNNEILCVLLELELKLYYDVEKENL